MHAPGRGGVGPKPARTETSPSARRAPGHSSPQDPLYTTPQGGTFRCLNPQRQNPPRTKASCAPAAQGRCAYPDPTGILGCNGVRCFTVGQLASRRHRRWGDPLPHARRPSGQASVTQEALEGTWAQPQRRLPGWIRITSMDLAWFAAAGLAVEPYVAQGCGAVRPRRAGAGPRAETLWLDPLIPGDGSNRWPKVGTGW